MDSGQIVIRIIRASEESVPDINGLIACCKAYWNLPDGYSDQALPWHQLRPTYLRINQCFEVLDAHVRLVAFVSVVVTDVRVVLDNLRV